MVQDLRRRSVRELFPKIIQWLAPAECLLCRETHNDRDFLCADCQRTLPRNEHACQRCATPISHSKLQIPGAPRRSRCPACHMRPTNCGRILAPFLMQGTFRELLHLWKFQNHPQLSTLMACLFATNTAVQAQPQHRQQNLNEHRILVPIPTQWHRQLRRGFDHTWLLAHALRSVIGRENRVRPWLRNTRLRRAQHRSNRADRWENHSDRFIAAAGTEGQHITLVDDVITTGATVEAAAAACKAAGATSVEVWALARTPATAHAG